MTKSLSTSLLTQEDFDLIRREGAPYGAKAEYVEFFSFDRLQLSPRGVQFYRTACILNDVDPTGIEAISTADELSEVILAVKRVKHELPESGVPVFEGEHYEPRRRVAKLVSKVAKAVRASSNVVFVDFRRRGNASVHVGA